MFRTRKRSHTLRSRMMGAIAGTSIRANRAARWALEAPARSTSERKVLLRFYLLPVLAVTPCVLTAAGPSAAAAASPVQRRIDAAQKRLRSAPESWQAYNDLAAAFCRKG